MSRRLAREPIAHDLDRQCGEQRGLDLSQQLAVGRAEGGRMSRLQFDGLAHHR